MDKQLRESVRDALAWGGQPDTLLAAGNRFVQFGVYEYGQRVLVDALSAGASLEDYVQNGGFYVQPVQSTDISVRVYNVPARDGLQSYERSTGFLNGTDSMRETHKPFACWLRYVRKTRGRWVLLPNELDFQTRRKVLEFESNPVLIAGCEVLRGEWNKCTLHKYTGNRFYFNEVEVETEYRLLDASFSKRQTVSVPYVEDLVLAARRSSLRGRLVAGRVSAKVGGFLEEVCGAGGVHAGEVYQLTNGVCGHHGYVHSVELSTPPIHSRSTYYLKGGVLAFNGKSFYMENTNDDYVRRQAFRVRKAPPFSP